VDWKPSETIFPLRGINRNTQQDVNDIRGRHIAASHVQGRHGGIPTLLGCGTNLVRRVSAKPLANGLPGKLRLFLGGLGTVAGRVGAGAVVVQEHDIRNGRVICVRLVITLTIVPLLLGVVPFFVPLIIIPLLIIPLLIVTLLIIPLLIISLVVSFLSFVLSIVLLLVAVVLFLIGVLRILLLRIVVHFRAG
jgi:hypothetical protein